MGIRNAELRSEEEELRSEKRRLILAREITLSPRELARTAKRLGFEEVVEHLQTPNVAATPNVGPPADATVIDIKSTNAEALKDEARKTQAILKTASVKAAAPAKNIEAKTAESTVAAKTVGEGKGETRARRIVETRERQASPTASSFSGLR